jgi:protein TonB
MTSSRFSFLLSLAVHGAALGTACFFGAGAASAMRAPLQVDVLPSEDAVPLEATPPPWELVAVEEVDEQPPLREVAEIEPPDVEAELAPDAFDPRVEQQFVPPREMEPTLDLLAVVKLKPAAAEPPPVEKPPAVVPPAPAARTLEVIPGENPPPDYPWLARRRGWQGVVAVFVHVGGNGAVTAASVARSSGHTVLDEAALSAVRTWRFRGGSGETVVEVEFRLTDA